MIKDALDKIKQSMMRDLKSIGRGVYRYAVELKNRKYILKWGGGDANYREAEFLSQAPIRVRTLLLPHLWEADNFSWIIQRRVLTTRKLFVHNNPLHEAARKWANSAAEKLQANNVEVRDELNWKYDLHSDNIGVIIGTSGKPIFKIIDYECFTYEGGAKPRGIIQPVDCMRREDHLMRQRFMSLT